MQESTQRTKSRSKGAFRTIAKKFALMLVATTFAMLIAEFGVRLLFQTWAPRTARLTEFWRFDPDFGWGHVPSSSGRFQTHGFDTMVDINSDGFRGPEIATKKDPSRPRVVVVGDSYVWGFGVNQEEIFTTRMENVCPSLEVINLGVSGYATDQELLLFREKGAAYGPDIVILLFASNDVASNARPTEYVYYHKPVFVIENDELVLTNRPVQRASIFVRTAASIAKRSYILTQCGRVLQGLIEKRMDQPAARPQKSTPTVKKAFPRNVSERVTALLLREFVAAVDAAGAKLLIVLVDGQRKLGRELVEFSDLGDVPVEHLDDYMGEYEHNQLHLLDDFHWNAEGHDLVARIVLQAFLSAKFISPEMCPDISALNVSRNAEIGNPAW